MGGSRMLWFLLCLLPGTCAAMPSWTYVEVDDARQKWGDWDQPEWLRYFGLDCGRLNNDTFPDLVSGRYVYLSPGEDITGSWQRVDLGINTDGMIIMDVDGDANADVIAASLPDVLWLEATDATATGWRHQAIAKVEATGHVNGQGYKVADLIGGGRPEILLGTGGGICVISVPDDPSSGNWPVHTLTGAASDEGFAVADLDRDGDLDVVASFYVSEEDGKAPRLLQWWENSGEDVLNGQLHEILLSAHDIDRIEAGDLNGDGLPDIVYSEERYPGLEPDAELVALLSHGEGASISWSRQVLATQYSMNSLGLGDVDLDGDLDVVTNEHKGTEHKTQLFVNDGTGKFSPELIAAGMEMHLGAKLFDLDLDGDLDLFGHAWDAYAYLHLWRNELPVVRISHSMDEGAPALLVETPSATYYYQSLAGGFSSILDRDGNDWIGYRSSGSPGYPESAASDYRGLPNLVFRSTNDGAGHPGFTGCTTVQIADDALRTTSGDGQWQWTWTFFPDYAEMTVEQVDVDHPYWFLYEGPIAGRFHPSRQYWGTNDGGPNTRSPDYLAEGGEFGTWDWIYLGDYSARWILLLQHLTPDRLPDCFAFLGNSTSGLESEDGMVVFGFGRERDAQPLMSAVPNRFRVSLRETAILSRSDHEAFAADQVPGPHGEP